MRKHIALASIAFLFGCSDLWTNYTVIDQSAAQDGGDPFADAGTAGCTPDKAYVQNGDTFTTCCYVSDSALSGSNVYKTIEAVQQQNIANPTIVIGCPEPRELPVLNVASSSALGEDAALPIIFKKITIDGNKCTLDAQNKKRHFLVNTQGALVLKNLTLKNGYAAGVPEGGNWPALSSDAALQGNKFGCGGAILSGGPLRLENVELTKNLAEHGVLAAGGALCLGSTSLEMVNTIIYDNRVNGYGAMNNSNGIGRAAAALLYKTSAKIVHSTVLWNTALSQVSSVYAAAISFDPGSLGSNAKFVANNSLFVNYRADYYKNGEINYAILFACSSGLTKSSVGTMLASNVFDDVLVAETCATLPGSVSSGLGISWTGTKWPEPAAGQVMISPVATWDTAFRSRSDASYCSSVPADFFGKARTGAGVICMPGAVEPRTN